MSKIALVQLKTTGNKALNLSRARELILGTRSKIVVLPECFNSLYGNEYFHEMSERFSQDSLTFKFMQDLSLEKQIILLGSFITEQDGRLFNTCPIFENGTLLGIHRKLHLFDIDIPGKIAFKESDSLSSGDEFTVLETSVCKIGVGICYDIRFPELSMVCASKGAQLMLFPGAFNLTTGPLHWTLLQRARAVDNQFFVAACSPARDVNSNYVAYGHSSVIDPMGRVLGELGEEERVLEVDLDLGLIQEARQGIPVLKQKRYDLYTKVKPVNEAS